MITASQSLLLTRAIITCVFPVTVIDLQQDDEDDDEEEEEEVSQGRNEPPSTAFWKQALF